MILPAFICLGAINLFPILRNLYLSFTSWDMVIGTPQFIGLRNYRELFTNSDFYKSLWVTLFYTIGYVPFSIGAGFLLAVLMTSKSRLNVIYRTAFFMPHVTSMVAMSAVFLYIYHPQYGTINTLLNLAGLSSVPWLNQKSTALFSLVLMNVWKSLGFCAVIYLGGILNIPEELEEAAGMDGGTWLQKLIYIKIPQVSPLTFMLVIMLTIESFKVFTQINVMTGGGPDGSTTNLLTYMFMQAFDQFRIGYGGAIAVVLLLCVLLINLIQMYFERFVSYD
ncbi:sugar ABC transporter permease [Lachnospiraceae bacterium 54-53]